MRSEPPIMVRAYACPARFTALDAPARIAAGSGRPVVTGASAPERQWHAELHLRFARRDDRTCLASRRHVGPLLVQRPFHPEGDVCHVYLIHPPGGIAGGDHLRVNVLAEPGAHVVLTTPAATKFYRSGERVARQEQDLTLNNAIVEWLPQESIFYRGANARAATRIRVEGNSKLIAWEVACLGLPARQETFDTGLLHLDMELWKGGCPLLVDRSRLSGEGAARTARWGLAGYEAVGILLAYPADRHLLEVVRSVIEPADAGNVSTANTAVTSATLVDSVLVCRCLAAQAEPVREIFVRAWRAMRPEMLGRPAVPPRIWAT